MPDLSPASNTTINDLKIPKIAIIGGGLTGLLTATLLERSFAKQDDSSDTRNHAQAKITIFEKSRSVGRLATRYRSDMANTGKQWQWAFGAQFFTAKSASFSQFIAPWLKSGLLQPWCAQVVELTATDDNSVINKKEQWNTIQARYISTPKMTSWGRELADNLQQSIIHFRTRVAPLASQHSLSNDKNNDEINNNQTELFDENGASLGWFDWVICTAPNGQAVELMAESGFSEQAKILKPKMLACYTLMLGWDNIAALPETLTKSDTAWDVAYPQDSILAKIFVEHNKPAHDHLLPSITIHASNDWSEAHVDEDIEVVQAQLLAAAQQALNWNVETAPSQIDYHRWRYAATVIDDKNEELGILVDKSHNWIVSGDWCGQGNIESCYRMAEQAVEIVIVDLT